MRIIILPILSFLNFIFACACTIFVMPWLLIWFFRWHEAKMVAEDVFNGIMDCNPEFYCPFCLLALILSPLWLLQPILFIHHLLK